MEVPRRLLEEACGCIAHDGPHWQHMDVIWKEKNHALLVRAGRYEARGRASRDPTEVSLYYSVFLAVMHLHAQEELARLAEIERHLSRQEREELAILREARQ